MLSRLVKNYTLPFDGKRVPTLLRERLGVSKSPHTVGTYVVSGLPRVD